MTRRPSSGFALPSAIFLLVVLGLLAGFIASIGATQQAGEALDVLGGRAYQAAFAGREWLRRQVKDNNACPANTTWGASGTSFGFPAGTRLADFVVTLECRQSANTTVEGVATTGYDLRVTACLPANAAAPNCPGNAAAERYIERQLQAVIFN